MFWDKISFAYDLFEKVYNKKVFSGTGKVVAQYIDSGDVVLECACGTGEISRFIAPECRLLAATDFSEGMLRAAGRKLSVFNNVVIRKADMTALRCSDSRFDKVVAGNVIHLLDRPYEVIRELERVCKPGGLVMIPTYINISDDRETLVTKILNKLGAGFKRQFSLDSYKKFFEDGGYTDVSYEVVWGRMPCAIAVLRVGSKEN